MELLAHGGEAVVGYDAIHANIGHLPPGRQHAGYTTGTDGSHGTVDIRWHPADWLRDPGAVRICQDNGSDDTADVLDDEDRAATDRDAAAWVPKAQAAFAAAKRPGQRWPAIYKSASGITALVNRLIAAGITSDVGLWVANWDFTKAEAVAAVLNAAGPFPIVAFQHSSGTFYDTNVFSSAWLGDVSGDRPGSFKHLTREGDTIGGLADVRNMDVWAWLALQRRLSGPQAAHLVRHAAPEPDSTWRSVNP